jgi:osmotically-inducible protein OsmY
MANAIMTRTEEAITTDVLAQLYWDTRVDATNVTVTVHDGRVTLGGSVPTSMAKHAAAEDAWVVLGVRAVENQLTITPPPTAMRPSDRETVAAIRSRLAQRADLALEMAKIEVSAVDGAVTLEGTVESYWKKLEVETEALQVTGVLDVTNKLAVVPTERVADEALARVIVSAIDRDSRVNVDDVDVTVSNGKVTLSGAVPSRVARLAAYRAALYTSGVTDIKDNIIVV